MYLYEESRKQTTWKMANEQASRRTEAKPEELLKASSFKKFKIIETENDYVVSLAMTSAANRKKAERRIINKRAANSN